MDKQPNDSQALQSLVAYNKNIGFAQKYGNHSPHKKGFAIADKDSNPQVCLAREALSPFSKEETDHRCSDLLALAKRVEPEVQTAYLHWVQSMDTPRWWVQHVQALVTIEADVTIDTLFIQLDMPKPSTLMMRAAIYTYMKALFWDYMREMKRFHG